jgi:hypothetical protein
VTIIAGFKCDEGVVLCADTQETNLSVNKRNVNKLRMEPPYRSFSQRIAGVDLTVAFCGSGDGPFIDMLIEELWDAAKRCSSHAEASAAIKARLKEMYAKYGAIYQSGYCPNPDILYAIRSDGESSLWLAAGPAVVEKTGFECTGAGAALANYIGARMYTSSLTLTQCVILAAYILQQAKNHVEGCGGESHIAVLRNNGDCTFVTRKRVEAFTTLVDAADIEANRLVLAAANLGSPDSKLQSVASEFVNRMVDDRTTARRSLNTEEAMWVAAAPGLSGGGEYEVDELGLVRPKKPTA